MFTRLLYYGMAHLSLRMEEVWLMPFGLLMDLWECHRQFLGLAKPKRELTIDDVIPYGILRGPHKAKWLCGERTNDGMSEFSCLHENEGYEVHEDEGRRCGPWRTILA